MNLFIAYNRAMSCARQLATACLLVLLTACGGSSPSPTTPPASIGPVTESYSGTTTQSGPGSCGGDSHSFTALSGTISIRLVQTTDPAGALSVQVCSGGNDTGSNCAIRQQKITAGETLTGTRVGEAAQTLKFLPHSCVFGGTVTPSVSYLSSLTYQR